MIGLPTTVNVGPDIFCSLILTDKSPVPTPAGATTTIFSGLDSRTTAILPLKSTTLPEFSFSKPSPVNVTFVPAPPVVGLMLRIT
ncbi:hypothetical protein D3C86_1166610 [compost metagenome]